MWQFSQLAVFNLLTPSTIRVALRHLAPYSAIPGPDDGVLMLNKCQPVANHPS